MRQLPLGVRLRDRADFENFHPGRNAETVDIVQRLVAADGRGVVWIAGPPGSGKSHLLQAACARLASGGYFPLADLGDLGPGVLDGAEALTIVCIDDVQRVVGQSAWEAALFRLYVEIEARHGRLLLAADRSPAELPFVLPDLGSRCAAAPRGRLRVLDEAEQRAALRRRAALRGLTLPDDAALYLQRHFPRDMATLQALLDRLDQASLAEQRRLTLPFVRAVLGEPDLSA
jgi:DnaA-homolog protein